VPPIASAAVFRSPSFCQVTMIESYGRSTI
jgi:hypothetical protein